MLRSRDVILVSAALRLKICSLVEIRRHSLWLGEISISHTPFWLYTSKDKTVKNNSVPFREFHRKSLLYQESGQEFQIQKAESPSKEPVWAAARIPWDQPASNTCWQGREISSETAMRKCICSVFLWELSGYLEIQTQTSLDKHGWISPACQTNKIIFEDKEDWQDQNQNVSQQNWIEIHLNFIYIKFYEQYAVLQ